MILSLGLFGFGLCKLYLPFRHCFFLAFNFYEHHRVLVLSLFLLGRSTYGCFDVTAYERRCANDFANCRLYVIICRATMTASQQLLPVYIINHFLPGAPVL